MINNNSIQLFYCESNGFSTKKSSNSEKIRCCLTFVSCKMISNCGIIEESKSKQPKWYKKGKQNIEKLRYGLRSISILIVAVWLIKPFECNWTEVSNFVYAFWILTLFLHNCSFVGLKHRQISYSIIVMCTVCDDECNDPFQWLTHFYVYTFV